MLVLTRKKGESIIINDDIEIIVTRTGNAVRLGFKAPDDVKIFRKELYKSSVGVIKDS